MRPWGGADEIMSVKCFAQYLATHQCLGAHEWVKSASTGEKECKGFLKKQNKLHIAFKYVQISTKKSPPEGTRFVNL